MRESPQFAILKAKRIAVIGMGAVDQLWIASILAYVGSPPSQ